MDEIVAGPRVVHQLTVERTDAGQSLRHLLERAEAAEVAEGSVKNLG